MQDRDHAKKSPAAISGGMENLVHPEIRDCTYHGERLSNGEARVWIESKRADGNLDCWELPSFLGVRAHSPTGYAWGYSGSGPAQLALSLMMDALGERELALRLYQEFKRQHVVTWKDKWSITGEEIRLFALKHAMASADPVRVSSGRVVATPGVLETVPPDELQVALQRHLRGDWGQLDEHDWNANEDALREGTRLLSAYTTSQGVKFWIISEADRSSTTALLPDEY